jgi:hypothetical protein
VSDQFSVHAARPQDLTDKSWRLMRDQHSNAIEIWDLTDGELVALYETLHAHLIARVRNGVEAARVRAPEPPDAVNPHLTQEQVYQRYGHGQAGAR